MSGFESVCKCESRVMIAGEALVGARSLADRLQSAGEALSGVDAKELPRFLQTPFAKVYQQLTAARSIEGSVARLSDEERTRLAKEIHAFVLAVNARAALEQRHLDEGAGEEDP